MMTGVRPQASVIERLGRKLKSLDGMWHEVAESRGRDTETCIVLRVQLPRVSMGEKSMADK